jgi:hypothetical protein
MGDGGGKECFQFSLHKFMLLNSFFTAALLLLGVCVVRGEGEGVSVVI